MDAPGLKWYHTPRWPQLQSALTDVPPGITSLVYFHPRGDNIRGIAEKWQPHVFDVKIVERLPHCTVELVTLINEISGV